MQTNSYPPFGLEPTQRDGGGGNPVNLPHRVASGTASFWRGDVMKPDANGEILAFATPGTDIALGVAMRHHLTGVAENNIPVIVDPEAIYSIVVYGGALAQTNIHNNALLKVDVARGAAAIEANLSSHCLDGTAMATTAGHDLNIVNYLRAEYNALGANSAVALVKLNKQVRRPVAGVIGV